MSHAVDSDLPITILFRPVTGALSSSSDPVRKRDFEDDTADFGRKRAMNLARGRLAACIMTRLEHHVECSIIWAAADDENFFGIRM
jgi:hypothetical protein